MIIEAISVLCKMGGVEIKSRNRTNEIPVFGQGKIREPGKTSQSKEFIESHKKSTQN